jgi:cell division septum initiation protein DivIVA
MELDRRSIERADFAKERRGYDREQVQSHLKEIADRVESLRLEEAAAPVADSAASQVRSIIQAAEQTGVELASRAREEADRILAEAEGIRAEADTDASAARQRATGEAAERLKVVHEASARVLEGAEAIERALVRLQEKVVAIAEALEVETADAVLALADGDGKAPSEVAAGEEAGERDVAPDVQDVRLIALNMALNGSPREETARYLEENFGIDEPDALLDEVYARASS